MGLARHASIRTKVAVAPAFAVLCLLVVVGTGLWAGMAVSRTLAQINKQRMPALVLAADLERKIAAIHASVNQSLVWEGASVEAGTIAGLDKRIVRDFDGLAALIDAQSSSAAWSEADRAILTQIGQTFGKFKSTALETLEMKSGGLATAAGFITRTDGRYEELTRLIADLVKRQHESARAEVTRAEMAGDRSRLASIAGLVVAVTLSLVATWWCTRLIARPLGRAVVVLKAVAAGDYTTRLDVESRDEVGQAARAINEAVEAMRSTLGEVRAAANHVAAASQQLSVASTHLSSGSHQQAASLEETAASLEEIAGTARQSADNARQASQLAVGSRSTAEKGGQVVGSAVGAMEEISGASRKIEAIIATIDEIAFQTNLLALNAAVEAARAGEQGRGFAVVAAEVRNLAQRAAVASREIKGLIHDSVAKVEAGSALVTESGATLAEIVTSVKRVTDLIAEIAAASAEQTTGIDQVNQAVATMDQVVQSNAAQTAQLSSTAQALAARAQQLEDLVGRFRIEGAGSPAPIAAPPIAARPVRPTARPTREPRVSPVFVEAGNGCGRPRETGFEEF